MDAKGKRKGDGHIMNKLQSQNSQLWLFQLHVYLYECTVPKMQGGFHHTYRPQLCTCFTEAIADLELMYDYNVCTNHMHT